MTLQRAVLTVEGTEFHMLGDVEIAEGMETGFLVGGMGSTINAILMGLLGEEGGRQGIYIDLGAGTHTIDINFRGWEGAQDGDGNPIPWGDVTGEDPLTQANVFMRHLQSTRTDSIRPATLAFGEYSSSGRYSALEVVVQNARLVRNANDNRTFDGSVSLIEAASLETAIDAIERVEW